MIGGICTQSFHRTFNTADMSIKIVLLSAVGKNHVRQACLAAKSIKAAIPDCYVMLYADHYVICPYIDEQQPLYPHPDQDNEMKGRKAVKLEAIRNCPYEMFIYLDTDVFVTDDIFAVFSSVRFFDLALVHDTWRYYNLALVNPPLNTGVIAVRRTPATNVFFETWLSSYLESDAIPDQVTFHRLFYGCSDCQALILATEFNARCGEPIQLSGAVRIVHKAYSEQWERNPAAVAHFLNTTSENRVWLPGAGMHCVTSDFRTYFASIGDYESTMRQISETFMSESFEISQW